MPAPEAAGACALPFPLPALPASAARVLTGDVPAFALVVGNPARRLGWVSHAGERLGPDLVCPRTGRRYREVGSDQLEEML